MPPAAGLPDSSINFVTCHDGFTLADLWSYNHKHNDANREGNRDGSDHNHSWNCGVEGEIRRIRASRSCAAGWRGTPSAASCSRSGRRCSSAATRCCGRRAATTTPTARTTPTSWLDWTLAETNADFVRFVREAIAFRRRHPVFRRAAFFKGSASPGRAVADITWLDAHLRTPDWHDAHARSIAFEVDAEADPDAPGAGRLLYLALNAGEEPHVMRLPVHRGLAWYRAVDTSLPAGEEIVEPGREACVEPEDRYTLAGRSVVILTGRRPPDGTRSAADGGLSPRPI